MPGTGFGLTANSNRSSIDNQMKNNILEIIAAGESEEVEFKISFGKEVIETVCAFANHKGGTIFIGVEDSGKIIGALCGPETFQSWINQIKISTVPSIIPDVEQIELAGKLVAAIRIGEFPIKPVEYPGRATS